MGSKGIQGITYEVGGNTIGLQNALKDVNARTKDLGTELSSVNRLLKLDPNNLVLVKQKQDLLKESISQTKDKLNTLKEAQSQVNQQFKNGDIGAEQYRAFQREVESTKSKLDSLKDEKKSVSVIGTAFDDVKNKASALHSKLEPIQNGLKKVGSAAASLTSAGISTVTGAVDIAAKGLTVYATTALAAGTAVTALTVKAAGAADDINTLSKQTGLSTEEIQKFQYASEIIDVDLETLTGSMAKLTKNMATAKGGTGDAAEAFKTLGVSITDGNGELRNNQDVMNDTFNALAGISNETERDALAMQIFGKSAQDLNPLILGGADALKTLGDQAEAAGLILSQDALDNLNGFNDSIDTMKAGAGQAGNILAGTFAGGLTSSVDIINQFLPSVTQSIAGLFSGSNMASTQKKLTSDLISGGKQLISEFASQLPTFLNGFNAIIISLVTAISGVLPTAISSILPTLLTGFTGLIEGLLPQIPVLLPIIINGAVSLFMGLLDGLNTIVPQLLAMLPDLIQNVSTILIDNLPLIITAGIQLLTSLITGITNSIPQLVQSVIELIPVITDSLLDNLPALIKAGIALIVALATGLPEAIPAIIDALPEIIKAIIAGFVEVDWGQVGIDIIRGVGMGLINGVFAIGDMIAESAGSLLDGVCDALGIHSPSTLFRDKVGMYLAEGIGVGFVDTMSSVAKDMQKAIPTDFDFNVGTKINGSLNSIKANSLNSQSAVGSGTSSSTPINLTYHAGDTNITVEGNADKTTVSKIKEIADKSADDRVNAFCNGLVRQLPSAMQQQLFKRR